MFFGLVLITIGIIFLLENMGVITGDAWKYIWPCLIILLGLSILIKPWRGRLFSWPKIHSESKEDKINENK